MGYGRSPVLRLAVVVIAGQLGLPMQSASAVAPSPNCQLELKRLVVDGRLADLRWPDFTNYSKHIRAFYEPSAYDLVWMRNGEVTRQAEGVIQALKTSANEGLNAEDYDGSRWAARIDSVRRRGSASPVTELACFDLALTVSVMRYVSDLHVGRVNPKLFHLGFDLQHEQYELAELIRTLVDATDVPAALSQIDPPFPGYRRTRRALQQYLTIVAEDDAEVLPATGAPLEPGSRYSGAGRLARLLQKLGDLPVGAVLCQGWYTGPLVDAIKRFQSRHALDPDGRIGAATLRQLNTPLSRRVRQLQLTLERFRWMPHDYQSPLIVVNIPEFRLRALNPTYGADLEMKVVVGRAYRHQTPVFAADMNSVVFRPYWEVPLSIQRTELVPKVIKDRSYLSRNGYEIVISPHSVMRQDPVDDSMLARLRSGKSRIRQVPGPQNSLGLVKFVFPNKYNVYMHGTPATALFAESRRDFSHGCIRLEKPEALAAWVLKDKPAWNAERIAEAMRGAKTVKMLLDKPFPVLIVYATAVVQESGEIRFFDDIYGHDAVLDKVLAEGFRYRRPKPIRPRRVPDPLE